MPLLQLALDVLTLDQAAALAAQLRGSVDIIEAGTPLIKRYGVAAITRLRDTAPGLLLVADMKTMDAGALEAAMAFDAGADIVTVLACASDATIAAALDVAAQRDKRVIADLIAVADKPARALQLAAFGVHMIGVHTGADDQARGGGPFDDLLAVRAAVDTPLAVAGGIGPQNAAAIAALNPAVIIAGASITNAADPHAAARAIRAIFASS
jgi:3-hexulose-6-phosphate synthase